MQLSSQYLKRMGFNVKKGSEKVAPICAKKRPDFDAIRLKSIRHRHLLGVSGFHKDALWSYVKKLNRVLTLSIRFL